MQSSQASTSETLCERDHPPVVSNDQEKAASVVSDVPDGGLDAWLTVAGSWLILFCTFGYLNAFGVFEDYYARVYMTNKSTSVISWIGSTQLCLLFMMGLVSGKLFDSGYFHSTIGFGSVLYVFCLFMLSLAKENQFYQVFLPQAIGLGLAQGLLFLPSVSVISHHFARRRSLAMGIVLSGSSCGGIVFPIMLNNVFKSSGFGWGVRSTAFVVLGCLVLANLLVRTRLPPKSERPPTPPPDFKGIAVDPVFQLCVIGCFLIMLGMWFPIFYIQLFAIQHNLDDRLAFYSLTILNAASMFGRTIPNLIADKFGIFNVIIPHAAILGALVFAMFGVTSTGALIVFPILYGFFSGAFVSLTAPMIVALSRHMQEVGARLGLAFFVIGVATLVGTPISGALLTNQQLWYRPIIFSGIVTLAGSCFLLAARRLHVRSKGHSRV